MVVIRTEVHIAAPIGLCFQLARNLKVHAATVWERTRESAYSTGPVGLGERVTFEATHFFIRQKLVSVVTEYNEPYSFTDEMESGAFKRLRHTHEFEESGGGTIMRDTLAFQAPFGLLGRLAEKLVLRRYMTRFLEHRNNELKKIIERYET
ncbi:SRPBCC family protein [Cohnella boryungensis]|uniref:SRPBCC family protein n=1 Tax=Cohnella boryungensis TaxID=768479 RepID=A0ABV8SJ44_9BACL